MLISQRYFAQLWTYTGVSAFIQVDVSTNIVYLYLLYQIGGIIEIISKRVVDANSLLWPSIMC